MNINQVFDTLVYGKGTVKRGNYFMYVSVTSDGEMFDLGYKKKELKTMKYYVTYKGDVVLVISQQDKGKEYDTKVIYDGRQKHQFNKRINKTLDKIVSYMIEPYSKYKEKYE